MERRKKFISSRRLMYWMYYLAGGVYSSPEISNVVKKLWLGLNFVIPALATAGPIGYLGTASAVKIENVVGVSWLPAGSLFVMITIPVAISRYYCDDLRKLLIFVESANSASERSSAMDESNDQLSIKRSEPLKETGFWLKLILSLTFAYCSIGGVNVIFALDRTVAIRDVQNHYFGFPYIDRIPTVAVYSVLYLIEVLVSGFITSLALCSTLLIVILTQELKIIAIDFCAEMRFQINLVIDGAEKGVAGDKSSSDEGLKVSDDFEDNLRPLIRRYQQIKQAMQFMLPFVQFLSSSYLISCLGGITSNILMLQMTNSAMVVKVKLFTASLVCLAYLYPYCQCGSLLNDMNEAIAQQVYDLPWYYLSPKQRKTLYIFMNQTQRPYGPKAFGIFPVDLVLLPKVLRITYSYANILAARLRGH